LMEKHFQIFLGIGCTDDDFGKLVIWYQVRIWNYIQKLAF
jgi:hypothetical protein